MKYQQQHEELTSGGLRVYWRLLKYVRPHLLLFSLNIIGFWIVAATDVLLVQFTGFLMNALERTARPDDLPVEMPVQEQNLKEPFSAIADRFQISIDWLPPLPDELMLVPFIVVFIYLLRGLGLFMGNYSLALVAQHVVHTLRMALFNKLTELPGRFFDSNDSGQLISKITFNVAQVTVAATDALKVVIREGSSFIVILCLLFYLNWKLTLVFVAIAPIIAILVAVAGKHLRRYSSRVQSAMGSITGISSEMIGGYKVMRNYGGEEYEKSRFRDASHYTFRQNAKIAFTHSLASSVNQFVVAVALGVLMFIAILVINPNGAAEIIMYMTAVGLLPKSMKQLSDVYNKIQRGLVAAHSIFLQLDEEPEHNPGRYRIDRAEGRVEFRGVGFAYEAGDIPAVTDIDLTVEPGEVVALVGRSGSGKSTLVSLVPRFYDYQQGSILLDGHDIKDFDLVNLRQQIALVTQNVVLFNDTVKANIAYGELASRSEQEILQAAERAHAMEFIEQLPQGLDTYIGEDGARLSGGQRQRLSIARALLKDAPVLILDEATSALDNESEKLIQQALDSVTQNRTTFVIAHRLSTIENADKIVVMSRGRIVEVGTHTSLLEAGGEYAGLHANQFRDLEQQGKEQKGTE